MDQKYENKISSKLASPTMTTMAFKGKQSVRASFKFLKHVFMLLILWPHHSGSQGSYVQHPEFLANLEKNSILTIKQLFGI